MDSLHVFAFIRKTSNDISDCLKPLKRRPKKTEIERRIEEEQEAIEALGATGVSAFPGPHSLL